MGSGCSTASSKDGIKSESSNNRQSPKKKKGKSNSTSNSSQSKSIRSHQSLSKGGSSPSKSKSKSPAGSLPQDLRPSPARSPILPEPKISALSEFPADVRKLLCGRTNVRVQLQQQEITVYHCALYSDSHVERDVFHERVYPKLQEHCMGQGFDLKVTDLHWGLAEEAIDDLVAARRMSGQVLKDCLAGNPLCLIVVFLNEKIGVDTCPAVLDHEDFESILAKIHDMETKDLLQSWYVKDENTVPHVYKLRPLATVIPKLSTDNPDEYMEGCREWEEVKDRIITVLEQAASPALQEQFLISDLERELQENVLNSYSVGEQVMWIRRTFTKLDCDINNPITKKYVDIINGHRNDTAKTRLVNLTNKLRGKVSENNMIQANVPWSEKGVDPLLPEHGQYLGQLCNNYTTVLKAQLDRVMEMRLEKARASLNKGVSGRLYEEMVHHTSLCQSLCQQFYGQSNILETLEKYITAGHPSSTSDTKRPLVLYGTAGSGKSSLAAILANNSSTINGWGESICIYRFVGASTNSTTLEEILYSICEQLCLLCGQHVPYAYKSLEDPAAVLSSLLQKIPSNNPLLLVIDGLDRLAPSGGQTMNWLPAELPSHVRLLVTVDSTSPIFASLKAKTPDDAYLLEVPPMSTYDARLIIETTLASQGHVLTSNQNAILEQAVMQCSCPLSAMLLGLIVCTWDSNQLARNLGLRSNLREQMEQFVEILEQQNKSECVGKALWYLAATRHGVSDTEMLDLLSCDEVVLQAIYKHGSPPVRRMPPYLWCLLKTAMKPFLLGRSVDSSIVYSLRHELLQDVIKTRYKDYADPVLGSLMDYFDERWSHGKKMPFVEKREGTEMQKQRYVKPQPTKLGATFNRRKLDELPYILATKKSNSRLKETLFNLQWMCGKLTACGVYQVQQDLTLALTLEPSNKDMQLLKDLCKKNTYPLSMDGLALCGQLCMQTELSGDHQNVKKMVEAAKKFKISNLVAWKSGAKYSSIAQSEESSSKPSMAVIIRIKGDKDHMVSVTPDTGLLQVWNIHNGEVVRTLTGLNQPRDVKMADSMKAVVLCNRELKIYNLDTGTFESKLKGVLNIKMPYYGIHDEEHVIALSRNRMYVNIMNNCSGDMVATFKVGEDRFLNSLLVSANGERCVCGDEVQKPFPLLVWDLINRKLIYDLRLQGHEFVTSMSAITNDSHYVVCVCKELDDPGVNHIIVYDLESGNLFKKWKPDYNTTCVAISSEASVVVSGQENGQILVWDLVGGSARYTLTGHKGAPTKICITEAGTRCVTWDPSGRDASIRLWDISKGCCLGLYIPSQPASCCEISADGSLVVIGLPGEDDVITLRVPMFDKGSPQKNGSIFGDALRKGQTFDMSQAG